MSTSAPSRLSWESAFREIVLARRIMSTTFFHIGFHLQLRMNINRDNECGTKRPGKFDREIVGNAPVNQFFCAVNDRGKITGNAGTGGNRLTDVPTVKNNNFVRKPNRWRYRQKGIFVSRNFSPSINASITFCKRRDFRKELRLVKKI